MSDYDPALFHAWYSSVIAADNWEVHAVTSAWWNRIVRRYNPDAKPKGAPGWRPFGGMMDR